jgi:E3 ubiquitin-protein ligase BRE1
MSKRNLKEEPSLLTQPNVKKSRLVDEGPKFYVSSQEELDINILRFQNRKLSERLETRIKIESDLRTRIEQLEKKQTSTEAVVFVVNRYWNQFNEDLRILLQRFDSQVSEDAEDERAKQRDEATINFLSLLSNWDKEELEESLQQRVEVSTRAVAKILQAFDRCVHRNEKINCILNGEFFAFYSGRVVLLTELVQCTQETMRTKTARS